ncbi:MAG: MBL fold metallo-hydrolase [Pseudomonadota bacterium]
MRAFLTAFFVLLPGFAFAQVEHTPAHCLAMVQNEPVIQQASSQALVKDEVRITFIDHAMYRIDTFGGHSVVTDFNGFIGLDAEVPNIVTMNRAHDSHFTSNIPEGVEHVLRGWAPQGQPAVHDLDLGELRVRNVTTDIRSSWSGSQPDGNSIFIFEVGGLCIGHLGHLHHEPSDEQYAMIGRLDVVMTNVDGGLSLNTETVLKIMNRVRASVVLPMHYWGRASLSRFLDGMRENFEILDVESGSIIVSQDTLPIRPTVYVLPPTLYRNSAFEEN